MLILAVLLAAVTPAPALPDAPHVVGFLNRTIAWFDRLDSEARLADQPTDVLYVNDNRQIARQVVTLSFDFAKASAQLITNTPAQTPSERAQRMSKRAASAAEQLRREQERLATLQQQTPRNDAAVAEAQSRVAMAQARNDAVSGIAGFNDTGSTSGDLTSQIAALEQTIPATTAPAAVTSRPPPSSVVGLISDVIRLNQKAMSLRSAMRAADALTADTRAFSTPLFGAMSQMRQRSDALMNQPDSTDAAELARRTEELDALTARFRQVSAAMLPLAKRRILLQSYKANLTRWRASVIDQRYEELRRLTYRAITLGVLLLIVVGVSVVWRRVTFRYVTDVKRRHHFLLIRRIVVLLLVAAILTATFASDFSSLTTFVGLLTAGIAIALQDVILSMAGYFVIVGKYGIRVGDRVRIASVNGDVLDVGLVWIYLMELETRGTDQLPTGRVVEFPNSVVFDHSAGIFKQLPGTRFLWHELSLTVPASSDFHATQEKMLAAVNEVFGEYRERVERQHAEMVRLLGISSDTPRPHSRLRVAPAGVEVRVRYPVEIENAGDVDDRVAAAVTRAIRSPAAPA